jgi:hypothetical protein
MTVRRIPTSFTAGRPIAFGERSTALATPVITKGTTATTGGTFTSGAKFWVVTAINADGETVISNEITATLATSGTQVVSWSAVTGSTGFKVYRGTATGAENKLVTTTGVVTTYTDTGTAGTTATLPVADTTTHAITYALGDSIPNATVKGIKDLSALLSRRWIVPNVDPNYRKTPLTTPTPTDVAPPIIRKAI